MKCCCAAHCLPECKYEKKNSTCFAQQRGSADEFVIARHNGAPAVQPQLCIYVLCCRVFWVLFLFCFLSLQCEWKRGLWTLADEKTSVSLEVLGNPKWARFWSSGFLSIMSFILQNKQEQKINKHDHIVSRSICHWLNISPSHIWIWFASPNKDTNTSSCICDLFQWAWPKFNVSEVAWQTAYNTGQFTPLKCPFNFRSYNLHGLTIPQQYHIHFIWLYSWDFVFFFPQNVIFFHKIFFPLNVVIFMLTSIITFWLFSQHFVIFVNFYYKMLSFFHNFCKLYVNLSHKMLYFFLEVCTI